MKHVLFLSVMMFIAMPMVALADDMVDTDNVAITDMAEQIASDDADIIANAITDVDVVADDTATETDENIDTVEIASQTDVAEPEIDVAAETTAPIDNAPVDVAVNTDVVEIASVDDATVAPAATAMDKLRMHEAARRSPRSGPEPKIAKSSAAPAASARAAKKATAMVRVTPKATVSTAAKTFSTASAKTLSATSKPTTTTKPSIGLDESATPLRSQISFGPIISEDENPL